jgi:pilus assembly protein Flp/PilA
VLTNIMNLLADEDGATMVEYGLIVALIAAVSIAVVTTLGTNIQTTFKNIGASVATSNKANP